MTMIRDPNSLYYESIDMQGAHHPQTILAYDNERSDAVGAARCAAAAAR